jgi:hypothetical protein
VAPISVLDDKLAPEFSTGSAGFSFRPDGAATGRSLPGTSRLLPLLQGPKDKWSVKRLDLDPGIGETALVTATAVFTQQAESLSIETGLGKQRGVGLV